MPMPQPAVPILIAVLARQRRIVRRFQEAGADRADRARTLADVGVRETHLASRLARAGVLVAVDGGAYFVSAEGLAGWNRRRNVAVLAATVLVLVGIAVALLLARG